MNISFPEIAAKVYAMTVLVTMAHHEDDLNVPATPEFLVATEVIIGGKPGVAKVEAPPASPLPMMGYQPESFRGMNASGDGGN